MKVMLAGYNFDYETIKELQNSILNERTLTPETISAAYARISRSPKQVYELRDEARREVDKARQSNRNIVFDMGHSSIAEHAVFNIDIIGVSRLLVEEIEKFRLCSYTEKSQRYVLFNDDFVVPEEVKEAGLEKDFVETVRKQNRMYQELFAKLKPHVFAVYKNLAAIPSNRSMLEGLAKEDARYIISLATETQLGMTINARNIELMLRRMRANPLAEAKEYGKKLYDITKNIAPSLIRYTEATEYDRLTRKILQEEFKSILYGMQEELNFPIETGASLSRSESLDVVLINSTTDADEKIIASLLHSTSNYPMSRCLDIASRLSKEAKENLMKASFRQIKAYDPVLREFEMAELIFELTISASCFAQLKRHRMATILSQDYDPALGVAIPPSVDKVGMRGSFMEIIEKTEEVYNKIKKTAPIAAAYILTNAHRRRVAVKVNAREMYHIARLRADRHAQWDIRMITEKMLHLAKTVMPLTMMLAAGKDDFDSVYRQIFPSDD